MTLMRTAVQEARRQEDLEKHAQELQIKHAKQVNSVTHRDASVTHRDTGSRFARISLRAVRQILNCRQPDGVRACMWAH